MASSSSQSSGTLYPMSFPLHKLSFCTTPVLASKMTWTHLPAQDSMFTVYDKVRKAGLGGAIMEKHVLKLIRGADVLEEIDLHDLKFQARLDDERRRSQSTQESDLLIVVIIKRPLVALRYQLPDGQIRRLQMNFRTEQGYEATVSVFESLGLSINDRNPTAEPPASSQHPASSRLTYPNPSPTNSQGCYSSTQLPTAQAAANPGMVSISNFANSAIASYKDRVPQANIHDSYPVTRQVMPTGSTGGLSTPSFPTHANFSSRGEIRPINSQNYHPPPVSHFAQGAAHADCSTSPNSVIRSSNSYGNEARPAIPQDQYLSALRDIIPTAPSSNMLPSPEFSTSRREIENQPTKSQNNGIEASGSITHEVQDTSMMSNYEFTTRAASSYVNEIRPTSSAPEPYRDRSSTAPLSLSQMLPPKRVLPFPRNPTNPEAAIALTPLEFSTADTSPAKKRKTTTKPIASTEATAVDRREQIAGDGPQQPEISIDANGGSIDFSSSAQALLKASEPSSTTFPSKPKSTPKPRAKPTPKPRKSALPKSGTKPAATECPPRSLSPKQSSSTSTRENPSRSLFGDDIAPAEFMTRLDAWVREYQHLPAPKPRDLIGGNLAAYAGKPRGERMAIIDDMICECLGDENFVKLLEDVDQSWRRIGLGM